MDNDQPTVQINALDVDDQGYLHNHYPMQHQPQDCHLELNMQERTLTADWNGEIGNAVPSMVWHGRIIRFAIPTLTADTANELMEELLYLTEIICDGYTCRWDGSNHVGTLDEKAEDAEQRMSRMIESRQWDDRELVHGWDAAEWFAGIGDFAQQAVDLGITAETTDEEIEAIAASAKREAYCDINLEGIHVLRGTTEHLKGVRDEISEANDA